MPSQYQVGIARQVMPISLMIRLHEALRLDDKQLVAVVGAGGKTTLMERLAADLTAQGRSVICTTTTKVWEPAGLVVVTDDRQLASALAGLVAAGRVVTVAAGRGFAQDSGDGRLRAKLTGVLPHVPQMMLDLGGVSHVLVEADGARGRSLKAPAEHEPVIPPSATVVVAVAAMDALGQPLSERTVHRADRVAEILNAPLGSPLSADHVAGLLAHPQGGRKGVPPAARFVVFLNKVHNEATLRGARAIASRLAATQGVDAVVIGAALAAQPVLETW